jgi:hypothetical protein
MAGRKKGVLKGVDRNTLAGRKNIVLICFLCLEFRTGCNHQNCILHMFEIYLMTKAQVKKVLNAKLKHR